MFQELIRTVTTAFWDAYLRDDAAAKRWLADGGCEATLGDSAKFEKKLKLTATDGRSRTRAMAGTLAAWACDFPGLPNRSMFRQIELNLQPPAGGATPADGEQQALQRIAALREKGQLQMVYCPQLVTAENQAAFVMLGRTEPRIVSTSTSDKGTFNTTTMDNVGLTLSATPWLARDGTISVQLDLTWSEIGPEDEGAVIAQTATRTVRTPRIDTFQSHSVVGGRDGQTVVLGDVATEVQKNQREVLVLVTARIVKGK